MHQELKDVLISHGFMDTTKSKQHAYMQLKHIIDELYMEDVPKCVTDVCAVSLVIKGECLSPNDIQELTEVAEDLCYYISQARIEGLSNGLLEKVRSYFNHAFYALEFQDELAPLGLVMSKFTVLINEYRESLIGLNESQIELVSGFVNDFRKWVNLTYKEHSATDGLENSIMSGFEQIEAMVKPSEKSDEIELW